MSLRVLQQSTGGYAVWSSVTDSILLSDLAAETFKEWYIGRAAERARRDAQQMIETAKEKI